MQTYSLNIVSRENTGRGFARRLRNDGRLPAALYGQGQARSISVSAVEFRNLSREIGGGAAVIELKDESGETVISLVQSIQRDAIKGTIDHIDFQEIERGHAFTTKIPVQLVGEADCVGVRDGGVIDFQTHEVEIRCRPSKLPENVEVDVSKLAVNEAVHISDLPELSDVEYLGEPSTIIISVQPPTVVAETDAESESVGADEVPATKVSDEDSSEKSGS
jgi:large subunit ribosomal protein L25